MAKRIEFDGVSYEFDSLTDSAKAIVNSMQLTDAKLVELNSLLAVCLRAKHAYMSDLKSEIIKAKSGIDLGDLFLD